DGTSWKIVPSPNNAKHPDDMLDAVSSDSPTDAWAVGRMQSHCGDVCEADPRPFALHWNGSVWSETPMPQFTRFSGQIMTSVSVDPIDADDAWAVGDVPSHGIRNEPSSIFAEHWNGRRW